jgi:OOP family OmpA-OmpF porin
MNTDEESLFDRAKNCIKSMLYTLPDLEFTGVLRTIGYAYPRVPLVDGTTADLGNRRPYEKAPLQYWLCESSRESLINSIDLLDEPAGPGYMGLAIDRTADELIIADYKPALDKTTIRNVGVDATDKVFKTPRGKMAVIIVSDGKFASNNTAEAAAVQLKRRFNDFIAIHTISVGNCSKGASALAELSRIGGGIAAKAEDLFTSSAMIKFVTDVFVSPDSDGDGVADTMDKCSGTPKTALADADGCTPDTDEDGVYDYLDRCPNTPKGLDVTDEGCPYDTDADGKYDDYDRCPLEPEWLNSLKWGCPSIARDINFDYRKCDIEPWMHKILDDYATVLRQNTGLIVEVSGHTSRPGTRELNQDLSKCRAENVAAYLTSVGVSSDRIRVTYHGPDEPIASNDTAQGRAKNRRASLKLVKE